MVLTRRSTVPLDGMVGRAVTVWDVPTPGIVGSAVSVRGVPG
jgi:hypothetical protein